MGAGVSHSKRTRKPSHGRAGVALMKHDLYQPERYEGCAACRVCKGFEGTLTTECPCVPMTTTQDEDVYNGRLDFMGGQWIDPRPKGPKIPTRNIDAHLAMGGSEPEFD
jgi:hypothetical protein